jgi:toxin-antitoxin system PIN domain toxin
MMVLCDVSVLLHGMVERSEHHVRCKAMLEELRRSGERFALSELVLAAVYRIGTNPRVFRPTPEPADVLAYANAWRQHPLAVPVTPGPQHWEIFEDLVKSLSIRGSDSTDAYFAALAMEHGCEWWSTDRGFARFPALRWRNPAAR